MSKGAVQIRVIIFILIAILAMLLTFKFGYLDAAIHIKELDKETLELRAELIKLNKYIKRQGEYENELWEIKQNKDELMGKYGAKVLPEKISLLMNEIGERTGAEINDIVFAERELVNFEKDGDTKAYEGEDGSVFFYKTSITINLKASNEQLKGVITLLQSGADRMNIKSVKATLEEGGKLETTIVIDAYAIS